MVMAAKIGLVKRDKTGKKIPTVGVPATVELFDQYEPAVAPPARPQSIHRLYSGYAHVRQWTLDLGAQRLTAYDSAGSSLALVQGIANIAISMTRRALAATERAMAAYE